MIWATGTVVALMDISSHATPTKELHWLSSIFAGVLMCKILMFVKIHLRAQKSLTESAFHEEARISG
ncbi:hypothetical protein CASFOL_006100 [Castilleja foliolosa]|uniref:Uncharacterized protein n=1 Tax=Castilleja foliolosa TaxID=1961234 RepID=A0ABD3E6B6_9LAMI